MVGFIGRALAGAGGAVASIADEQFKADLLAERDKRLQEFQSGEAQKGRDFTAEQNQLGREHTSTEAQLTRSHQANLADQQIAATREQGEATRALQRDLALLADERTRSENQLTRAQQLKLHQISSSQALSLAAANRPLQQDAQGNFFTRSINGKVEYLLDPSTGDRMKGPKDPGGTQKIFMETIQAQIKEVEKAENLPPEAKAKRMGELYRDLVSVAKGSMPDTSGASGGKAPDGGTGWDSKTGDVMWMGSVMKRGATREEAQRLLAKAAQEARGPVGTGTSAPQQSRAQLQQQIGALSGPQGYGNPALDDNGRGLIQRQLDELAKQYAATPQ